MRTLVYEPRVGGHFLNIAGQVAAALADAGAESHIVVAAKAPGRLEFESSIAPLRARVHIHPTVAFEEGGGAWQNARRSVAALKTAIYEIEPKRTYLPTADGLIQWLALTRFVGLDEILKRTHLEALLMNGAVGHPELLTMSERWRRRAIHQIAKRGCHTLFHLNPFVRDWELASGCPESRCVRTMPDPVEVERISKADARAALGLPLDGRIVGMVGRLDQRKGAHVLIEAFLSAELGDTDSLLLWGPIADDVRSHIRRLTDRTDLKDNVFLRDTVLEPEQFYSAIAAMDLLALPYTSPVASSSIVIRAAAAGRPVVTTAGGWAERVMRNFPLGWTFEGPDPVNLAAILPRCLDQAESWVPAASVGRFVEYNSPTNFAAHWTNGLRRALGGQSDPSLKSWQELLEQKD